MVIKKVRDNELVTVHANAEKTVAGSRHYIHAEDVSNALLFLFNYDISKIQPDSTGAKCQKFNIVGKDEIDNLELAQFIAKVQNKDLNYESSDEEQPAPVKYCSKKKIAVATKEKSIENIKAVGDDNIKLVKKTETFERQTNRSPKRRKKDFDSIFDSRYGMCIIS